MNQHQLYSCQGETSSGITFSYLFLHSEYMLCAGACVARPGIV